MGSSKEMHQEVSFAYTLLCSLKIFLHFSCVRMCVYADAHMTQHTRTDQRATFENQFSHRTLSTSRLLYSYHNLERALSSIKSLNHTNAIPGTLQAETQV